MEKAGQARQGKKGCSLFNKIFYSIVAACLLFVACLSIKLFYSSESSPILACYMSLGTSQDPDPFLCNILIAAFGSVVNNELQLSPNSTAGLKRIVSLKLQNPSLKVSLSIGGANDDEGFPQMVLNHANRKIFIASVLEHVKQLGLDGIDLDWEYPNRYPGADPKQRQHFSQLLFELRREIQRQERHRFMLSVAVAGANTISEYSYDIPFMNEQVDFVNLMSYDYHFYSPSTPVTGLNSPLFPRRLDPSIYSSMNINSSVNFWLDSGLEPGKLLVGLPLYGHTFALFNQLNNGIGAPSKGYGTVGSLGFAGMEDICAFLALNETKVVLDADSGGSPYAVNEYEWISFESEDSITAKASFARRRRLGGVMLYSVDLDAGCDQAATSFPLTRAARRAILACKG